MNAGRLSKKTVNVHLVSNLIKTHVGLALSPSDQEVEKEFRRAKDGSKRKTG